MNTEQRGTMHEQRNGPRCLAFAILGAGAVVFVAVLAAVIWLGVR